MAGRQMVNFSQSAGAALRMKGFLLPAWVWMNEWLSKVSLPELRFTAHADQGWYDLGNQSDCLWRIN